MKMDQKAIALAIFGVQVHTLIQASSLGDSHPIDSLAGNDVGSTQTILLLV